MARHGVAELLQGKRVCICAGSGGVGKTTTSAAIATGMAARGLRVAVLTIDPARRLADSLGMVELGNEARRVDPELLAAAGVEGTGELWAMMLDAKATFDEVIRRNAPDAATRDRILSNRIYQQLSSALAGSQEYMAMEKLYELWTEGDFDLLVLDTPPSRDALEFLDAPKRLVQFIEGRALRIFMRPTGFASRVIGGGASMMFSILRRITGVDLLQDLAEFFQAFGGMVDGFRERARRVDALLAAPETSFIVVCAPEGDSIGEAAHFHAKLVESELPFGGAIVNKVHFAGATHADGELESALADALGDPGLAARLVANHRDFCALAERDRANIEWLAAELGRPDVIQVPYLDDDVHDIAGLVDLNRYLFATGVEESTAPPAERLR